MKTAAASLHSKDRQRGAISLLSYFALRAVSKTFFVLSTIIEIVLILSIVSTIIEIVVVLADLSITVEIDKELACEPYYQTEIHKADCAIRRQAGY